MPVIDLKQNFARIVRTLQSKDFGWTNIAKAMGYTTTAQLHKAMDGDSSLSTKAIIGLIKNLNVNPNYLFLGKGNMFLSEEDETEELNRQLRHYIEKHADAVKVVMELNEIIKKLEKRNADLIDMTSAAIKYHKGNTIESEKGEEMQKNKESTHSK